MGRVLICPDLFYGMGLRAVRIVGPAPVNFWLNERVAKNGARALAFPAGSFFLQRRFSGAGFDCSGLALCCHGAQGEFFKSSGFVISQS